MRILLILAIALFSLPSLADNLRGFYAGATVDFIDGNAEDATDDSVDFRGIEALGGYKYNSWIGGEVRVGLGLSGESIAISSGDEVSEINVDIDHYESLYYRAESANTTAKLYGLLGYTNLQTTRDDTNQSSARSGVSYGVGVGFVLYENANLNFEYRQLLNSADNEFTAINMGFDYRF